MYMSIYICGFPGGSAVKNSPASAGNAGDVGLISGSGGPLGGGNSNPWTEEPDGLQSATAKLLQLCLTLCDPIDGSPPGSPVPGIIQARTLEWVAISFSKSYSLGDCK